MKLTTFFIRHPVIAIVINALLLLLGLLSIKHIPVREYPEVRLPVFSVEVAYPNASAELVELAVVSRLEDQLSGLENLDTITSSATQGRASVQLTFKPGTSVDKAMLDTRDAVGLARAEFPSEVEEPRIRRSTETNGPPFIAIALSSSTEGFGELNHYAEIFLKNGFRSLPGVSNVRIWGRPYTLQIQVDLPKMLGVGVNVEDIYQALKNRDLHWPLGKFEDRIPVTLSTPLHTVDDFNQILITEKNGKPIYLQSIADVALKTEDKQFRVRINGQAGLILSISKTADANPLKVSDAVRKSITDLNRQLPDTMKLSVVLDQADFIRASLTNIESSIVEAIILVLIIVFLFLRNLRATIIPLIAIPISLIGGIVLLKVLGFSINTITLLAMILAIGLVVDDAIVILENITRHIEAGLPVVDAAIKGSREIGFAIMAMTFTLASVYCPIVFIQGAVGQLFTEFAVALAGSVILSGVVALSLSPVMCAYSLKPSAEKAEVLWPGIDRALETIARGYKRGLSWVFKHQKSMAFLILGLFISVALLFQGLASETAPKEDRGLMGIYVPSIAGRNIDDQERIIDRVEKQVRPLIPEAMGFLTFLGDWGANLVVNLKPHAQRGRSAAKIVKEIQPLMNTLPSTDAHVWSWDSGLPGLDDALSGSELTLVVSTVGSYRDLLSKVDAAKKVLEDSKAFVSVHHNLKLDNPGFEVVLNENILSRLGLTVETVTKTISTFLSGDQSLKFTRDGIRYPITVEARKKPESLNALYVTTPSGKSVSVGTFAEWVPVSVPEKMNHYNQMRSAYITVNIKESDRLPEKMECFRSLVDSVIPATFKKTWTAAAKAYQEDSASLLLLFGMAIIFIYAILSMQFENFIDPFIILCTVPLGCFGALLVAKIFHQSLNIYTQIGLVTLIGLITKHGILIVEFANQCHHRGQSLEAAVKQAASLRLRPILMTTAAMVLGALPLVLSGGAGAEARHAIGFILLGGLLFGTLLTVFLLPMVYCWVKHWLRKQV